MVSGLVDCRVRVASGSPVALATSLGSQLAKLMDARECLTSARSALVGQMSGRTVTAIRECVDAQLLLVGSHVQRVMLLIAGLEALGEDLGLVETGLYAVLMEAEAWGLRVVGGVVHAPGWSDPDREVKVGVFARLSGIVGELRAVEEVAHAQFAEVCKDAQMLPSEAVEAAKEWQREIVAARSAGVTAAWSTALLPGVTFVSPDSAARKAQLEKMISNGEPAQKVARAVEGWSAGRVANESTLVGRWAARVRSLVQEVDFSNRVAIAGEASATGKALRAGRTVLRGAGVVGGILTVGSVVENGYEQARDDSIDPGLTMGERVARTVTHGLLEGGFESAGESAGAIGGGIEVS